MHGLLLIILSTRLLIQAIHLVITLPLRRLHIRVLLALPLRSLHVRVLLRIVLRNIGAALGRCWELRLLVLLGDSHVACALLDHALLGLALEVVGEVLDALAGAL